MTVMVSLASTQQLASLPDAELLSLTSVLNARQLKLRAVTGDTRAGLPHSLFDSLEPRAHTYTHTHGLPASCFF